MITVYISKSDTNLQVNWDSMPAEAQQHIIEYGLRQKLNDAGSQFKKGEAETPANALAAAELTLESLMQGKVTNRQAAQSFTLEEKMEQKVIRGFFKKICGRAFAKERDQSNEALLQAMANATGRSAEVLRKAMQPRIDAEILAAKAKPILPDLDLDNL